MRRLTPVIVVMEKELSDYHEICSYSDKAVDFQEVVDMVLDITGWTKEDIFSTKRSDEAVVRRGIIDLIATCNGVSLLECGKTSKRDHTTIINSLKSIENRLDTEKEYRNLLKEIMAEVRLRIKEKGE